MWNLIIDRVGNLFTFMLMIELILEFGFFINVFLDIILNFIYKII